MLNSGNQVVVVSCIGSVASGFSMESLEDEKDGDFEASIPKELGHPLASNGTKFVDEVLKGPNELCLENFRMDKHESVLQLEDPMPPLEIEQPLVPAETQIADIPFGTDELEQASQLRDAIATDIWNDYIRDYAAIDNVV
ncbi:putative nuclease HARBI1 [Forsythia ovata]|uniref:Nuclease HARBI1 n=1 Tax=Forsythia ovata TaxID=205694 RepID=A0ABD1S9W0_9LAMI